MLRRCVFMKCNEWTIADLLLLRARRLTIGYLGVTMSEVNE